MSNQDIKVLHTLDWFLIGVAALCLVTLAVLDVTKTAQAQQTCLGDCSDFVQPVITQDPVVVLQRLNHYNRGYYAAEIAEKNRWRSYGYDVGMAIYGSGSRLYLPEMATVRGEYDLELQRRSLCAGFAFQGAEGVYAGRALDCRRDVFD